MHFGADSHSPFAVALGLHRQGRRVVLLLLLPMATGTRPRSRSWPCLWSRPGPGAIETGALRAAAGAVLVLWAAYHWLYGHRHRVRVGMTTGLAGLALWSFLMANGRGAGLMLVPALMPLCAGGRATGAGPLLTASAAVGIT